MHYRIALAVLLALSGSARAHGGGAQATIQAAYDRTCTAMKYKYVDGVLGVRDADYRTYTAAGRPINPADDLASLQRALSTATRVTETSTIVHFAQVSDKEARARVNDVLELDQRHPPGQNRPPIMIRVVADDTWVLEHNQWKLKFTHLLQQTVDNN